MVGLFVPELVEIGLAGVLDHGRRPAHEDHRVGPRRREVRLEHRVRDEALGKLPVLGRAEGEAPSNGRRKMRRMMHKPQARSLLGVIHEKAATAPPRDQTHKTKGKEGGRYLSSV